VKFPADADNIRYDARGKRVIVGYAGAKQLRKRAEGTGGLGFLDFPMALDEAHHRLFVGTWTPSRMLVFDTQTAQEIASGDIAGPSDDLFYDSRRSRVYVLTAAGFLEVFQEKDPDHYVRIAHYPTPPHTQTGLFVPEWARLFAAVQRQAGRSAEIQVYEAH